MGGSGTFSFLRRGLLAACWTAFVTEVADVVGWYVQDVGANATGSAVEIRARRLITGCWRGLAHHSTFAAGLFFHRATAAVRVTSFRCSGVIFVSRAFAPRLPERYRRRVLFAFVLW